MTTEPPPLPSPDEPASHPGAPRGNHNALKHGFYSQQFKRKERLDLERHPLISLEDEIAMLRVQIRRVMEQSAEVTTPADSLDLLRALSVATFALCRLINTHNAHRLFERKFDEQAHNEQEEVFQAFHDMLTAKGW